METEALVRDYIDACNEAFGGDDSDRIVALLHPDVEMHEAREMPGAVSAVGIQSVTRYLERFGTYWQEFRWEPLEFVARGDRVLMPAVLHVTGRESGIPVAHEWFYVFTISDGLLRRQDVFTDRAAAEAALDSP
ncbi:MAG TPA: nuclear transport factor 2 family protein [Thermoleophilaceae bacterium]